MSKKSTRKRGIVDVGDTLNWRGGTPASKRGPKTVINRHEVTYKVIFIPNDPDQHETEVRLDLRLGLGWRAEDVAIEHWNRWPIRYGDHRAELRNTAVKFQMRADEGATIHRIKSQKYPHGTIIPRNGNEIEVLNGLFVWVSSSSR